MHPKSSPWMVKGPYVHVIMTSNDGLLQGQSR